MHLARSARKQPHWLGTLSGSTQRSELLKEPICRDAVGIQGIRDDLGQAATLGVQVFMVALAFDAGNERWRIAITKQQKVHQQASHPAAILHPGTDRHELKVSGRRPQARVHGVPHLVERLTKLADAPRNLIGSRDLVMLRAVRSVAVAVGTSRGLILGRQELMQFPE